MNSPRDARLHPKTLFVVSDEDLLAIYFPLCSLLEMHVNASHQLRHCRAEFLQNTQQRVPFILGITGAVSVGKTACANLLCMLLSGLPFKRHVQVVSTDSFLLPTEELRRRDLLRHKEYPESYDNIKLHTFLTAARRGISSLRVAAVLCERGSKRNLPLGQ
jgi:type I pantothenate kinase